MKTLPICRALLPLVLSAAALAAAPTDSKITAATVYLDRAVVTRTAAADRYRISDSGANCKT